MSDDDSRAISPSRRNLLKGLTLLPVAAVASAALDTQSRAKPSQTDTPYTPTFFSAAEWAFINAACDRLIPHDDIGPGAIELGVPEFLDRHMQTPYASGDIWYLQGPFLEAPAEFGYQGRLPLRDILRHGSKAMDARAAGAHGGKTFAQLEHADQEKLLQAAEKGELDLDGLSSKIFFAYLLGEVRNGYFADPRHGGNRNMGAWKMIGYPGMRADYLDWVQVRDKPYPLPPVDLSGRRG